MCRVNGTKWKCECTYEVWDFCERATDAEKNPPPGGMYGCSKTKRDFVGHNHLDFCCSTQCCQAAIDEKVQILVQINQYWGIPHGQKWGQRQKKDRSLGEMRDARNDWVHARTAIDRVVKSHVEKCLPQIEKCEGFHRMKRAEVCARDQPIIRLRLPDLYYVQEDKVEEYNMLADIAFSMEAQKLTSLEAGERTPGWPRLPFPGVETIAPGTQHNYVPAAASQEVEDYPPP